MSNNFKNILKELIKRWRLLVNILFVFIIVAPLITYQITIVILIIVAFAEMHTSTAQFLIDSFAIISGLISAFILYSPISKLIKDLYVNNIITEKNKTKINIIVFTLLSLYVYFEVNGVSLIVILKILETT